MNELFNAVKKALKSARSALIVSHVDPDGDSIGSMNALAVTLAERGLAVDHYSQDGVPKIYRFLPGSEFVKTRIDPNRHYDLLIAVDASDIKRLGEKADWRSVAKLIINIDHHPDNTNFGDINYVQASSSTAELIYQLLRALKLPIDRKVGDNLYVGLITDTGNFRYENTTAASFLMAHDLVQAGVQPHELASKVYDNKSLPGIRIGALAMSDLQLSSDHKIAWIAVSREMMETHRAKSEDLVGLIDMLRSIEGVEVAMLFREDGGQVKVNFRSKSRVNVSEIARRFGGGGHIRAAGAALGDDLIVAQKKVVGEVLKYVKATQYLV